jgi:hypothetical protein
VVRERNERKSTANKLRRWPFLENAAQNLSTGRKHPLKTDLNLLFLHVKREVGDPQGGLVIGRKYSYLSFANGSIVEGRGECLLLSVTGAEVHEAVALVFSSLSILDYVYRLYGATSNERHSEVLLVGIAR